MTFLQGSWIFLALVAIVVLHRRLKALAAAKESEAKAHFAVAGKIDAIGDWLYQLSSAGRAMIDAAQKDDRTRRLRERVEVARNIILANWPKERRGDWELSFPSPIFSPADDEFDYATIGIFYPEQDVAYEVSITITDPVLAVHSVGGNCALFEALGLHYSEDHEQNDGRCSSHVYGERAEEVLRQIGEFLSQNPRGFPLPEATEVGEETVVDTPAATA